MKKILITGANSYVGTSFEKYMAQWPDQYQVDTIDMKDGSWREKSFSCYDTVFHVAGIAHIKTSKLNAEAKENYWAVNAELPVEVARKAKREGVSQFIFLSSMSVYGEEGSLKHPVIINGSTVPHPKDIYGQSKLHAEEGLVELEDSNFCVCILRPPMIYGKGCKGNYQLLSNFAQKSPVFPDIKNQRSMLYIENLSEFVRLMVDYEETGLFFPQNDEYVCTTDMVSRISQAHRKRIKKTKLANWVLRSLSSNVGVFRKVFGSLTYDHQMSQYSPPYQVCSYSDSICLTEDVFLSTMEAAK